MGDGLTYKPWFIGDCFIDVPDEAAIMLHNFELLESAYRFRTYRHKAYYSLDRDDGIEANIYTHLDFSSKVAAANAIIGAYPKY